MLTKTAKKYVKEILKQPKDQVDTYIQASFTKEENFCKYGGEKCGTVLRKIHFAQKGVLLSNTNY